MTMQVNKMSKQSVLIEELETLTSEGRNPSTMEIDLLDTNEILNKINDEDQKVADAVKAVLPNVELAVNQVVKAFIKGARLIFIGAGTSGRMGVVDSVECVPTFSVSPEQVVGIIAGGEGAIFKAVEGAEDSTTLPIEDLRKVELRKDDVVVGLAASGRTPYVIAAMQYAKKIGSTTICVTCSPNTPLINEVDIDICPVVGPEALTGSTRLKSATAQKMVLNMLTTASMIKMGKSYQNLMVDVNASNEKLHARAVRIVMQATDCDYDTGKAALDRAKNSAKIAILLVLTGVTLEQGQLLLEKNNGFLRLAIDEANNSVH